MRHATLDVIQDEHQALSAMLRSMTLLLADAARHDAEPDFAVLRAMLFYVEEFPERLHHTKESQLLFPKVRERVPALAPVLDRLESEHANGEKAIRHLEHTLLAYEVMGDSRRAAFEQALSSYTDFYFKHMATEEQQVLPAARAHFSDADWTELDLAFAENRDPLTGHEPDDIYRPLFQKILMSAPAPIGLGPAN